MIDETHCGYFLSSGAQCANLVDTARNFCIDHEDCEDNDIDVYKVVGDHFRQDLKEYWTRFNFYLVVQGALLTVSTTALINLKGHHIAFNVIISLLGLGIAIHWYMVAVASIAWCNAWGKEFIRIQRVVDKRRTYEHAEQEAEKTAYWSVDRLIRRLVFVSGIEMARGQRLSLNPNRNAVYLLLVFAPGWILLLAFIAFPFY